MFSVFVGREECCIFLQCTTKFGANRVCQVDNMCTYILIIIKSILFLPFYNFFFRVFLLLLLPIFFETSFLVTFDLTFPLIRPFENSARQNKQTPWWAALAQQAQRRTCCTNRPVWPGCIQTAEAGRHYTYTMNRYVSLRYTKYILWIYIIALVYTIDIPRISYMYLVYTNNMRSKSSYAWYKPSICI